MQTVDSAGEMFACPQGGSLSCHVTGGEAAAASVQRVMLGSTDIVMLLAYTVMPVKQVTHCCS